MTRRLIVMTDTGTALILESLILCFLFYSKFEKYLRILPIGQNLDWSARNHQDPSRTVRGGGARRLWTDHHAFRNSAVSVVEN